MFWTYYLFIGGCVLGFGCVTFLYAEQLAAGDVLGRVVAGFLALFWTARLVVAGLVFKMEPYLTNGMFRAGYAAVNAVFVYFIIVYALAAFGVAAAALRQLRAAKLRERRRVTDWYPGIRPQELETR